MTSVLIGAVTLAWESVTGRAWSMGMLSVPERARAEAFRRPVDRAGYVASRVLLRRTVASLLDTDGRLLALGHRCVVCGSAEHGRPVLATDPSVQLSLSRTVDRVVVAAARGVEPIGVDVEAVDATHFDGFDDVALTPSEISAVAALPAGARPPARADYWARKEAVLKARGVGLTVDPAGVDPAAWGYELTRIDVGAGYACWLAAVPAPGSS